MADVAREAGVSLSLVSLAFRNAYGVSESTRAHILATADGMGYQPNTVAARLASRENRTLGVYLLDLHNEVFVDMFDGIRGAADAAGRELVLTVGSVTGELDGRGLDSLLRARVDVVVAAGLLLPDTALSEYTRRLRLVSIARLVPGADSLACDNVLGGRLAVEHLVGLGHRRIAHLAPPPSDGYLGRREGFTAAMREAGLTPRIVEVAWGRDTAARTVAALLDGADPPTAIFAHNDQAALGALDVTHERGLRVPEDLSIVGYDNTSASRTPGIALTTVDLHARELGRSGVELALARSSDPDRPAVVETSEPTLVVRASTGPPAQRELGRVGRVSP